MVPGSPVRPSGAGRSGVAVIATVIATVIAALAVPACGGGGGGTRVDETSSGRELFVALCARCHGRNGEGGVGPQLSDGRVLERFPDEADQIAFVRRGRGAMPAFGRQLGPRQIERVVRYTRTELQTRR